MTYRVERLQQQPEVGYHDVRCDGCNVALQPAAPIVRKDGAWTSLQPEDALEVHLMGGYGMAIDPCDRPTPILLFCAACLRKLCEAWPCFMKVIQDGCSSSIGHDCARERRFVWGPSPRCCDILCSRCGRYASVYTGEREAPGDQYARPIVECLDKECRHTGPGAWAWERQAAAEASAGASDDASDAISSPT